MNKKLIRASVLAATLFAAPFAAQAAGENNVGSCGWGSKLFEGQSGLFPQILATWTNGTLGNQTFAISSGTSGCTQDGTVSSNWKTAAYIDGNKERLARDMSRGSGESLDTLAQLLGVKEEHKAQFVRATRENFGRIFPSAQASTDEVRSGLKQVLSGQDKLAAYTTKI